MKEDFSFNKKNQKMIKLTISSNKYVKSLSIASPHVLKYASNGVKSPAKLTL